MMGPNPYLNEIHSIDEEIKRTNVRVKTLKNQRTVAANNLYVYMVKNNLEQVGEGNNIITLKKCAPKQPRQKVKPKKERRIEAIELFRQAGLPDPEQFYNEYEKTQKAESNGETIVKTKKPKKGGIDPLLGF